MIQNKVIYEIYSQLLLTKIGEAKEQLLEAKKLKDTCSKFISVNKKVINSTLNVTVDDILSFSTIKQQNTIKYPIFTNSTTNFKAIKLYIDNYIKYNKSYMNILKYHNSLKTQLISYTLYNKIVKKCNTKASDKIIYENYKFSLNEQFGYIYIIKNENHRKRVNWQKSLKVKEEIIKRGGIPYRKKDALNNADYKGEFWLHYHPAIDFFFHWNKNSKIVKGHQHLLNQFTYKPARQGSSNSKAITTKLREVTANRDYAFKLYTTEV